MQKRGIFSLVLLLALSNLFAAQDITDLGTAYELVIAEISLAEAETNTASSVSVITKEQIAAYNAQTTAELIEKAVGTAIQSYGSLGSLQNVVIRIIEHPKLPLNFGLLYSNRRKKRITRV